MTTMRGSELKAGVFIGGVAVVGAALIGKSFFEAAGEWGTARGLAWAAIALLTVFLGNLAVRIPVRECKVSFSDAFLFLSVVLFGPALATLTGALDGMAASTRRRGTWFKRVFNTASIAITTNLSARLFEATAPHDGLWGDGGFSPLDYLGPLLLVTVAQYAINTALVAGVLTLKEGASFVTVWRHTTPWAGTAFLAGAASVALALLLAHDLGLLTFVALAPIPAIVYISYRSWLGHPVGARKED
ncbi:MAG: hypothetical protein ACRD6R_11945 [Candidatus Polarisedimenticolia bacterium]